MVLQARQPLALLAQLQQQPKGCLLVAGDERVGERPDLALGRAGAALVDLVHADAGARAVLERELLELAQQALLALADLGDQRLRRLLVELEAELRGPGCDPAGELRGLTPFSAAISPPGFSTALCSAAGALARPSSRAKKATVASPGPSPSIAAATAATSASFQRSTPSAITNRRPIANVIAVSAPPTASAVQASPSNSSTPL